jgi:hypothetical protein
MIHACEVNGLPVQTGDIACTMNGKPNIFPGEFWRLVGRLVPGDVDHIANYIGPEGRFVEAGALGVVTFEIHGGFWLFFISIHNQDCFDSLIRGLIFR